MPVLRNELASVRAGGPRQFSELRSMLMIKLQNTDSAASVKRELSKLGLKSSELNHAPVLIASPEKSISDVLQKVSEMVQNAPSASQAVSEVQKAQQAGQEVINASMAALDTTRSLVNHVSSLNGVSVADFVSTQCDYGPANLRISPEGMQNIQVDQATSLKNTLGDLNKELGLPDAWKIERGDQAIVADFDTGYSKNLIATDRIVGQWHGSDVDSVYDSAEGHGTMTSAAATANNNMKGVPWNGVAPDCDVILCRITDSNGQIRSDYIASAWDYIQSLNKNRPIIVNNSYGTPLCTGRPRVKYCDDALAETIRLATSDSNITGVYAAGNEAMQCGHRPSGLTNAVTGHNSLAEVITVGALRFDQLGMQRYTSHGRGDCSPIADPKPNVSNAIPMITYHGSKDGWVIKNMSMGVGGSAGGTSHATPMVTGMIALLQSRSMKKNGQMMQNEEIKNLIRKHAKPPHATPVNATGFLVTKKGYDARFGYGQIDIVSALNDI